MSRTLEYLIVEGINCRELLYEEHFLSLLSTKPNPKQNQTEIFEN